MQLSVGDTDRETTRTHLALIRRSSAEQRLRLAFSLSRTTMGLTFDELRRRFPHVSTEELALRFVARLYGTPLADELRGDLAARRQP